MSNAVTTLLVDFNNNNNNTILPANTTSTTVVNSSTNSTSTEEISVENRSKSDHVQTNESTTMNNSTLSNNNNNNSSESLDEQSSKGKEMSNNTTKVTTTSSSSSITPVHPSSSSPSSSTSISTTSGVSSSSSQATGALQSSTSHQVHHFHPANAVLHHHHAGINHQVLHQAATAASATQQAAPAPPTPITFSPSMIQQQQFHLFNPNFKDTRWLTLEVCREYQRNKCNRTENECKFAHPPAHVEIVNGKVIACYDSLKGKCTRREPPCKYLHPPQHLKDQLLLNGKNNLVLRQVALAMMQPGTPSQAQAASAMTGANNAAVAAAVSSASAQSVTNSAAVAAILAASQQPQNSQYTTAFTNTGATNPGAGNANNSLISLAGLSSYQQVQLANGQSALFPLLTNGYHPAHHQHHLNQHLQLQQAAFLADHNALLHPTTATMSPGAAAASANGLIPPQQRTDRLQICVQYQNGNKCDKSASECPYAHPPASCPVDNENSNLVVVCVDFVKGKCSRDTCKYFHPPEHLIAQLKKQKQNNTAVVQALASLSGAAAGGASGVSPSFMFANLPVLSHQVAAATSYRPVHPSQYRASPSANAHHILSTNPVNLNGLTRYLPSPNVNNNLNASNRRMLHSTNPQRATDSVSRSSSSPVNTTTTTDKTKTTNAADLNEIYDANTYAQMHQQYQLYAPIYSTQQTPSGSNSQTNSSNGANTTNTNQTGGKTGDESTAVSVSANAAVNAANMVDVVQGNKKRPHDAIDQDYLTMSNLYGAANGLVGGAGNAALPVKRAAYTDSKTGLPIYHTYTPQSAAAAQYHHLNALSSVHQLHQPSTMTLAQSQAAGTAANPQMAAAAAAAALNYQPINFPIQYISLPYNGQPSALPRF